MGDTIATVKMATVKMAKEFMATVKVTEVDTWLKRVERLWSKWPQTPWPRFK